MRRYVAALALAALWTSPVLAKAKSPIRYHGVIPDLPFSVAVEVDKILYISGQIGVAPGDNKLVPGGIEAETRQTMDNIGAVLRQRGLSFRDVFKCTVMLADMADWGRFNTVYLTYFEADRRPARSAFGSSGLAFNGRLELECWARVR